MVARVYIVIEDVHWESIYICGVYKDERDAAEEVQRLEKEHLDEYEGYRTSSFYYDEWKVREPQDTSQPVGESTTNRDDTEARR